MEKFRKWLDNYWYHYKWHTIITLFVVVFVAVCSAQMLSKEKIDVYVMYAGPSAFGATGVSEVENAFVQLTDDTNGDGKKTVEFIDLTVMTDEQIEAERKKAEAEGIKYNLNVDYIRDTREKFRLQVATGDAYICLLDPQMYMLDRDVGAYRKLSDIGVNSEYAYDEYAIRFKDTEFGKLSAFSKVPDDTLICFRILPAISKTKGKSEQAKYDAQLEVFKKAVSSE